MMTLCATPRHRTPFSPACASAAPTRPPISACDEDEGRPSHQVIRFQVIAPSNAARSVWFVTWPRSMMPFPTVFATAVVTKAPARFATAAIRTASRGDSARVETDVATAFAVSWNPFVKSNASATTMTTTRRIIRDLRGDTRRRSPVLDEDRLEDVGGGLAGVDRLLELFVDVLPADDRQRVGARPEELGDRLAVQPVALVLQLTNRDELLLRVPEAFEETDRFVQARGRTVDHLGLFLRSAGNLAHLVGVDVVGSFVDVVAHVVDCRREAI